ncbi:hypothetical protein NUW58_g1835 [Xylaria curta]|uniref:Uncharacterized protein n=1 Tax=Xylaria curta TaxID=42375 RepID=A0ACC1PIY8_9PEZI|nr:hypothetical protein NUW58_g1835 [Xylaria curta]
MDPGPYDFWKCGHITSVMNGAILCPSGDPSRPPLDQVSRGSIKDRSTDSCWHCSTKRMIQRLQDIRFLLTECYSKNDVIRAALKRGATMRMFLEVDRERRFIMDTINDTNYPDEFVEMSGRGVGLGDAVCRTTLDDLVALQKRFQSRPTPEFVESLKQIRERVAKYIQKNRYVKDGVSPILKETENLIEELERNESEELQLLGELDEDIMELRGLYHVHETTHMYR